MVLPSAWRKVEKWASSKVENLAAELGGLRVEMLGVSSVAALVVVLVSPKVPSLVYVSA